jgi:hypothetical protein
VFEALFKLVSDQSSEVRDAASNQIGAISGVICTDAFSSMLRDLLKEVSSLTSPHRDSYKGSTVTCLRRAPDSNGDVIWAAIKFVLLEPRASLSAQVIDILVEYVKRFKPPKTDESELIEYLIYTISEIDAKNSRKVNSLMVEIMKTISDDNFDIILNFLINSNLFEIIEIFSKSDSAIRLKSRSTLLVGVLKQNTNNSANILNIFKYLISIDHEINLIDFIKPFLDPGPSLVDADSQDDYAYSDDGYGEDDSNSSALRGAAIECLVFSAINGFGLDLLEEYGIIRLLMNQSDYEKIAKICERNEKLINSILIENLFTNLPKSLNCLTTLLPLYHGRSMLVDTPLSKDHLSSDEISIISGILDKIDYNENFSKFSELYGNDQIIQKILNHCDEKDHGELLESVPEMMRNNLNLYKLKISNLLISKISEKILANPNPPSPGEILFIGYHRPESLDWIHTLPESDVKWEAIGMNINAVSELPRLTAPIIQGFIQKHGIGVISDVIRVVERSLVLKALRQVDNFDGIERIEDNQEIIQIFENINNLKISKFVISKIPVNPGLVREVDLGPFKHRVDEGLQLRKAALNWVLKNMPGRETIQAVLNGLSDHSSEDVLRLCAEILTKLDDATIVSNVGSLTILAENLVKSVKVSTPVSFGVIAGRILRQILSSACSYSEAVQGISLAKFLEKRVPALVDVVTKVEQEKNETSVIGAMKSELGPTWRGRW